MVKLTGPCMSLGASGTIANAITFAQWKGRPYARQRVIPSNPETVLQVSMRAMFKFISQAWDAMGSTPKGTWQDRADATNILKFNAYVAANMRRWREFQPPSQTDPAPETGTAPVAVLSSATGGVHCMDILLAITTLNNVWGVVIFRSPTGTFTPSLSNVVQVLLVDGTGNKVWTDSGLAPGDYYYDAMFFTKEGVLGTAEGEVTGTAT